MSVFSCTKSVVDILVPIHTLANTVNSQAPMVFASQPPTAFCSVMVCVSPTCKGFLSHEPAWYPLSFAEGDYILSLDAAYSGKTVLLFMQLLLLPSKPPSKGSKQYRQTCCLHTRAAILAKAHSTHTAWCIPMVSTFHSKGSNFIMFSFWHCISGVFLFPATT